ncbi:uncharacterized protein LOC119662605, partial [Teleopsis dalmanni]|uniref:uncharacterized protein LOC119662605 n=1 Tax=Teleopsis dalmanni TaxID=139649 RepID=UPI0018CE452E
MGTKRPGGRGIAARYEGRQGPQGPVWNIMSRTPPHPQNSWRQLHCLQINLHRAIAASYRLSALVEQHCLDFVAIQEPWATKGRINGLQTKTCKLIYDNNVDRPRTAIMINKTIKSLPITELIQRDLVAVQAEVPSTRGTRIIVFASLYLPGDAEEAVSLELQQLTEYCRIRNLQWVMCCDANAHHTVWGSTDINTRGESLFDYITTNNLMVVNKGNEPTFVNAIREEVLDLTLASAFISNNISNCSMLEKNSLSDHRYIRFNLKGEVETRNVR